MHISPSNKRYIGITSRPPKVRWANGEAYKKQAHFYNAIKKYGWGNIDHVILCEGLNKKQAIDAEIELIAKYNATNPKNGYNTTQGGEGSCGVKASKDTRIKMSLAQKTRMKDPAQRKAVMRCLSLTHATEANKAKRAQAIKEAYKSPFRRLQMSKRAKGELNPFYGKHHTEETKQQLAELARGKCGELHPRSKPTLQYDVSGNFINRYESAHLAAIDTGIEYRNLNSCLRGKSKSAGGYKWRYEEVTT